MLFRFPHFADFSCFSDFFISRTFLAFQILGFIGTVFSDVKDFCTTAPTVRIPSRLFLHRHTLLHDFSRLRALFRNFPAPRHTLPTRAFPQFSRTRAHFYTIFSRPAHFPAISPRPRAPFPSTFDIIYAIFSAKTKKALNIECFLLHLSIENRIKRDKKDE